MYLEDQNPFGEKDLTGGERGDEKPRNIKRERRSW
jgi:hypothetical protein